MTKPDLAFPPGLAALLLLATIPSSCILPRQTVVVSGAGLKARGSWEGLGLKARGSWEGLGLKARGSWQGLEEWTVESPVCLHVERSLELEDSLYMDMEDGVGHLGGPQGLACRLLHKQVRGQSSTFPACRPRHMGPCRGGGLPGGLPRLGLAGACGRPASLGQSGHRERPGRESKE